MTVRHFLVAVLTVFMAGLTSGLAVTACIPVPTQEECFRQQDCRTCTISFCAWCGTRPGVQATGKGCYVRSNKPLDCEEPPHVAFCYQEATTPINNRALHKKLDGGVDAGDR